MRKVFWVLDSCDVKIATSFQNFRLFPRITKLILNKIELKNRFLMAIPQKSQNLIKVGYEKGRWKKLS